MANRYASVDHEVLVELRTLLPELSDLPQYFVRSQTETIHQGLEVVFLQFLDVHQVDQSRDVPRHQVLQHLSFTPIHRAR